MLLFCFTSQNGLAAAAPLFEDVRLTVDLLARKLERQWAGD